MRSRFQPGRSRAASAIALVLAFAPAARAAGDDAKPLQQQLDTTRHELSNTQAELKSTRSELADLKRVVEGLKAPPEPAEPIVLRAPAGATARIPPVNADNPAVSFVVDTALATSTHSSWGSIGYPDGWDFTLKNAELFISAPIDPFLRGYASINGTSDEGFDVEEAALVTTSLPWGLAVKGGRFFADVGRLPHWHDEALPFVDRPASIDRLIGGESGSEGVEVSWLLPVDLYVALTGGLYDAVGAENLEALNENGFFGRRSFDELNVMGKLHAYFDLTDTLNIEGGGSWVGIPRSQERNLWAADLTLRHQPGTQSAYQGFDLGAEWMWNSQRFTERDATGAVIGRMRRHR